MTQKLLLGIITVILAFLIGFVLYNNYGKNKFPFQQPSKQKTKPTPSPESQLPITKAPKQTTVKQIKLFFIALNDNGKKGKKISCGDSVVSVVKQVEPTTEPLKVALEELLAAKDQFYRETGLYNAFYQSDISLQNVSISKGGIATIHLLGTQALSGVCDDPRIIAQITETTRQFSSVSQVQIFINGYPIEQLLFGKGE